MKHAARARSTSSWRARRRCGPAARAGCRPSALRTGEAGLVAALQPGDPDHVELVEVGGEDRQELGPLQQRLAGVLGEREHAGVEVEPGQLAVEEAVVGQLRGGSRGAGGRADRNARDRFGERHPGAVQWLGGLGGGPLGGSGGGRCAAGGGGVGGGGAAARGRRHPTRRRAGCATVDRAVAAPLRLLRSGPGPRRAARVITHGGDSVPPRRRCAPLRALTTG